jgi:hypothetical protein
MVIGANIGTTITVLLGALGGTPAKKRVSFSHLIFNVVTGAAAFAGLPAMIGIIDTFVDIGTNSLTGLALFHTLFNLFGVALFFSIMGPFAGFLTRIFPDHRTILTASSNCGTNLTPPNRSQSYPDCGLWFDGHARHPLCVLIPTWSGLTVSNDTRKRSCHVSV